MSLSTLPPATRVAGRYLLDRELARGGMGAVWLARDERLGRDVAVKLMTHGADSAEMLARFEREALAVAKLSSSHVVEVYDYGVHQGLPFIVMELLRGEPLSDRIRRVKRFAISETVHLFGQICRGLRVAHEAGLVHRDIKPSNVFLARRDDVEVAVLIDFGVVKAVDPIQGTTTDQTTTGALVGTPQYMSPEQARAVREIDHRSDLWSAAVIAFRLLTGKSPFRGGSLGDVVLRICSDAIPSATNIHPDLPLAVDRFFARAFERDRRKRFQHVEEMLAAFRVSLGLDPMEPSWSGIRHDELSLSLLPGGLRGGMTPSPLLLHDEAPPSSAQPTAIYDEASDQATRVVDEGTNDIDVDVDDATTTDDDGGIPGPLPAPTAVFARRPAPGPTASEDATVGGTASGLSPLHPAAPRRARRYVAAAVAVLVVGVAVGLGSSSPEPLARLKPLPAVAAPPPAPPPAVAPEASADAEGAPDASAEPSTPPRPAPPRVRRPPRRTPPPPRSDRPDWGL